MLAMQATRDFRRRTNTFVRRMHPIVHAQQVKSAGKVFEARPLRIPTEALEAFAITSREKTQHIEVMHRALEEQTEIHIVPPGLAP